MTWEIGDKVNVRMTLGVIIDSCEIVKIFNSGYKVINTITGSHWLATLDELICPYYINDLGVELCDQYDSSAKRCSDCPVLNEG